jgi:glycosyltransferase involved in cell wall biosynthesis
MEGYSQIMRVLLANYWLRHYAGSETFTYAIWEELKRRGHSVDVLTCQKGDVSDKMTGVVESAGADYDVAIYSHNLILPFVRGRAKKTISLLHSPTENLEKPTEGADEYVSISEEVQKVNEERGFKSRVVWNGVNLDRFRPIENGQKGKVVLCVGNSQNDRKKLVREACQNLGFDYVGVGLDENSVWHTEKFMQAADVVVTAGRGVYEAMACGKPVICYGAYWADGIVTPENIVELMKCNCSGRNYSFKWDVGDIENAVNFVLGSGFRFSSEDYRKVAVEHFDIRNTVSKILGEDNATI